MIVDRDSALWGYIDPELKGLIGDGEVLVNNIYSQKELAEVSDFSFLVFPFAKAYEGFLKKLFFDLGLISHDDYFGDEIRIGRILNPNFTRSKGNIYGKFCKHLDDTKLPSELWDMWHRGRNRVFHYFPHNFRKLEYEDAVAIVQDFVSIMERAVDGCDVIKP